MGCFDSVCSFSKLPLHYGNDMVTIYVTGSLTNGMGLNYHGWQYFSLPIFGKYNDYGRMEEIEGDYNYELLQSVLETIEKYCPPMRCGSPNDSLFERFDNNVQDGTQMIGGYGAKKGSFKDQDYGDGKEIDEHTGTVVYKCMIHRSLYDYIVTVGENATGITDSMINEYSVAVKNAIENSIGPLRERLTSIIKDKSPEEQDAILDMMARMEGWKQDDVFNWQGKFYRLHRMIQLEENDCYAGLHSNVRSVLSKYISENLESITSSDVVVKSILNYAHFRLGTQLLNLEVSPHYAHACNQYYDSSDLDRMTEFRKKVQEQSDSMMRQFEDDE